MRRSYGQTREPRYNYRMSTELHIHLKPDTFGSAEEILADFPFEENQSIVSFSGGVIIIDLAGEWDTNYVQEWYLNNHDDVTSFYVVDD